MQEAGEKRTREWTEAPVGCECEKIPEVATPELTFWHKVSVTTE